MSFHLRPHFGVSHPGTDLPLHGDRRRRRVSVSWAAVPNAPRPGRRPWPTAQQIRRGLHGRWRGSMIVLLLYVTAIILCLVFFHRVRHRRSDWPVIGAASTLVFRREDLQKIWLYEIARGHYSSRKTIPKELAITGIPSNPARPLGTDYGCGLSTHGVGPRRIYLDRRSHPPHVAYPPRPIPGSAADFDILHDHCDFSADKYVRDCLELLRVGAGLDNKIRARREISDYRYIFVDEEPSYTYIPPQIPIRENIPRTLFLSEHEETQLRNVFPKARYADWETSPITLPASKRPSPRTLCDSENPRLFHMYWTGPFTDKPYLALLSFLYTQNLGLHLNGYRIAADEEPVCPPKLWVWISPGKVGVMPDPNAHLALVDDLSSNPWASPFLHPRFKDIISFKLWNTTEQLDSIPELRDDWRTSKTLLNSGGNVIAVNGENATSSTAPAPPDLYDRLSVVMSDMARFLVCHRFGGIYIDTDTIFLRDWEELWNYKMAFAYRWSFHEKYNTAVLRLNKESALGLFLLRSAFKNDLDFHPMVISRYMKDGKLENMLYRLPDALFDPAWLNMESYQRDRPPQPFFSSFQEFFDTLEVDSATPQAVGFDGFFKGAFSYHFHNSWRSIVDPARNYPDLGSRFGDLGGGSKRIAQDHQDLSWAAVLKRTFEAYLRGEQPNMYGEWIDW